MRQGRVGKIQDPSFRWGSGCGEGEGRKIQYPSTKIQGRSKRQILRSKVSKGRCLSEEWWRPRFPKLRRSAMFIANRPTSVHSFFPKLQRSGMFVEGREQHVAPLELDGRQKIVSRMILSGYDSVVVCYSRCPFLPRRSPCSRAQAGSSSHLSAQNTERSSQEATKASDCEPHDSVRP